MPLSTDLTLPLDYSAIQRILPHRYPFLLVDRITELEPDRRFVGIKNVSLNERFLSHQAGDGPALPPTILTEAVAQVGAILILSKPENREKLIFFAGRLEYEKGVQTVLDALPLKRFGTKDDVAQLAIFLAAAPYVTGSVHAVDGGMALCGGRFI